jgi:hypothetical protein
MTRAPAVGLLLVSLAPLAVAADRRKTGVPSTRVVLTDGTIVPASEILELNGQVVVRSPVSGLAQSFSYSEVSAVVTNGREKRLGPKSPLAAAGRRDLPSQPAAYLSAGC